MSALKKKPILSSGWKRFMMMMLMMNKKIYTWI